MTEKRHAYLIMAHHREDLLRELLAALDDPRNDVFVHIDSKNPDGIDALGLSMDFAGLKVIPSINVNWAGYSQIECAVNLLSEAVSSGEHAYYHLLTGASYPLKTQDEIHRFFDENDGKEFVEFVENAHEDRVQYVYLFNEGGKAAKEPGLKRTLRTAALKVQQKLGVDRFSKYGMKCMKGLAYWSITHELASYIVECRDLIKDMMRFSVYGDELFMQTILYNSPLRDRAFDSNGKQYGCKMLSTWPIEDAGGSRPGHNFQSSDLEYLLESDALFAFKFEGSDGPKLIKAIKERNMTDV